MLSRFRVSSAALIAGVLLCAAVAPPALAQGSGALKIDGPWTRATVPGASVGGGYLTVINKGATGDRLTGASSPAAARAEMHQMAMEKDIMRMREVKGMDVPANGTLELKPGGYHLMFIELKKPFKQGETVPVTLTFEKAGKIDVELAVKSTGASAGGETKHGAMKSH